MSIIKNMFNRKSRRAELSKVGSGRTSTEINAEYQQACAAVGDRAFQTSILKAQTEELYKRMHVLGDEMNKALKRDSIAAEEARKKEAKAQEESKNATPTLS